MREFFITIVLLFYVLSASSQEESALAADSTLSELRTIQNLLFEEKLEQAEERINELKQTHFDNPETQTRITVLESDLYRKSGNRDKARELLAKLNMAEIAEPVIQSEVLYQKSKLAKENPDAIELINKAISLRNNNEGNSFISIANYYNSAGIYQQTARNFDSAIIFYQKAIESSLNENPVQYDDLALFYQNLALPYAITKKYEQAKKYLLKSTGILKSNHTTIGQNDLARNYNNLGRLYFITSLMDSAEYYYNKSEKLRAKLIGKNKQSLADLYLNMGGFYSTISNFEKAESYYKKSMNIYDNLGLTKSENYYKTNLNLGYNYVHLGDYVSAISYLNEVINSPFNELKGTALRHLAESYLNLNQNEKAELKFLEAIAIFSRLDSPYQFGLSHSQYGSFLVSQGKVKEGQKHLRKAKSIFIDLFGNKHRDVALILVDLAKADVRENKFEEALQKAHKVLTMLVKDFDDQDYTKYPVSENLISDDILTDAVLQKGRIFYQKHLATNNIIDLENAYEAFKIGLKIIEKKRLEYEYQSNQLNLTKKAESDYDMMLNVLTELYEKTDNQKYLASLFDYMERSKAAVLLASITDSKAKISANIPDSVLNREKYLRSRMNGLKKLIFDESQRTGKTDTEKISEWESMVFEIKQEYQAQRQYIKDNFPEYFKLRLSPETLSLEETINQLDKDQAILEYSLLEDRALIMLITKDYQELFISKTPENEINRMIESIRNNLIVKDFVNFDRQQFRSFVKETHQLYNSLIKPLENRIENKSLVFIPDGKMGFIPMELLLTSDFNTEKGYMNYKSLPYLIKKHPVSYAYSSTLLHKADLKELPSKKKVFAMAPSYDNISRTPVDSLFNHRQKTTLLMPIPGAKQEVENISEIFRSDRWTGKAATESTFTEKATGYAILHLAMHTIVNDENPMYSKLVFYQEEGQEEDNLLNTYELFDLKLNAEMAVLSACNTGYGKLQRGEGIMSLARGFLYAGVPSIVMTLWPIEDAATADIMKQFYENLAEGMQKDDALRKAKLDFLENTDMLTAHPHFWASFVNIGPAKPLNHTQSSLSTLWWIGGGLILLLLLLLWRYKNRS